MPRHWDVVLVVREMAKPMSDMIVCSYFSGGTAMRASTNTFLLPIPFFDTDAIDGHAVSARHTRTRSLPCPGAYAAAYQT